MTGTPPRARRADALRNRDRVLAAAVRAFTEHGPDASVNLIAKEAGVGIGTLYRHFPTREALIEAAYRNELAAVCDAAADLLAEEPPVEALRAWMHRFIDYMATKLGMAEALRTVIASGGDPYAQSRNLLTGAIARLLDAATAAGEIRDDANADDLLIGLSGIAMAAGDPERRDQAGRLIEFMIDALRYRPDRSGQ
ncbi:TetR family transcriptional regulator [Acrocarpospora phusangensis]|uniref:TetR family transcriptional regulator n=1 Tax=Acrocarpospora phusangensis TaxID=1070424 RepID=A0A919UI41_9ACTN|nr:TetR/AcrR family transcriptional regulator [Acrocarpospora phusangensis]GIH22261.1 TetR family transcriptional regulator [Acrocarpospora phusangensis]